MSFTSQLPLRKFYPLLNMLAMFNNIILKQDMYNG